MVASRRPDLALGVCLLNATPFWSSAPNPETEPEAAARFPWDARVGTAPLLLRAAALAWWGVLRSPAAVKALLRLVYTDATRLDDAFVAAILEPTRRPQAADVFTSILFSPRPPRAFDAMLSSLVCPVSLVYGREDPWVVPLWGQRAKRALPGATYYEVSPAGHCPHHERPEIVNALVKGWTEAVLAGRSVPLADGSTLCVEAPGEGGRPPSRVTAALVDGSPRNVFEKADAAKYKSEQ